MATGARMASGVFTGGGAWWVAASRVSVRASETASRAVSSLQSQALWMARVRLLVTMRRGVGWGGGDGGGGDDGGNSGNGWCDGSGDGGGSITGGKRKLSQVLGDGHIDDARRANASGGGAVTSRRGAWNPKARALE